jgi:DNA-binding LytR/AlgR family response regulator
MPIDKNGNFWYPNPYPDNGQLFDSFQVPPSVPLNQWESFRTDNHSNIWLKDRSGNLYKFDIQQKRISEKSLIRLDYGYSQALTNINSKKASDQTLILQTHEGELRFVLKDIIRIEGERNYSYTYLVNNKKKLTTKTLGDLEELLDDKGFFRCHKSHLVNLVHIQSGIKAYAVTLSKGEKMPVSRRKKEAFKIWLESNAS